MNKPYNEPFTFSAHVTINQEWSIICISIICSYDALRKIVLTVRLFLYIGLPNSSIWVLLGSMAIPVDKSPPSNNGF
jgi:hypothetical protein